MNTPYRLIAARAFSVLALVAAIGAPWLGWVALAVAVGSVVVGTALLPPPESPSHEGRLRRLYRAIQRRLVRHPWRLRHP